MKAVPAIRSKMGDTVYYQTHLTGRELSHIVRPVRDSDTWASNSIEERIQRELDDSRVERELVPYIANHKDRFWGSIIVLAERGQLDFEPITKVVRDTPRAYQQSVDAMGFLTQLGGEMIALDGQHRWLATHEAITSATDYGPLQKRVNDDQMPVIVIEFESAEKTRRIFSKVNRHAKATGRSDNILLSEDDGYAIVTRWLLDKSRGGPFADVDNPAGNARALVNWKSTTLSRTMKHLTTLSALYECTRSILSAQGGRFPEREWDERRNPVRPSDERLDEAFQVVTGWWETALSGVPLLADALSGALDLDAIRAIRFNDTDSRTLLLRPVGQIAMVKGVLAAMQNAELAGKGLRLEEALSRACKIDWSASASNYFRDSIVRANGTMSARAESYALAAGLISYLIGNEFMADELRRGVWRSWNAARGKLVEWPDGNPMSDDEIQTELAKLDPSAAVARTPEPLPAPVA
jgi:DNA sulfur modification protein DndB